jgi:hypothetical protein
LPCRLLRVLSPADLAVRDSELAGGILGGGARRVLWCARVIRSGLWRSGEAGGVAMFEGERDLSQVPVGGLPSSGGVMLSAVKVERPPWRGLDDADIAGIWACLPPGSVLYPVHCGANASLIAARPDGGFAAIEGSPIAFNVKGAWEIAYGDVPMAWELRRPLILG